MHYLKHLGLPCGRSSVTSEFTLSFTEGETYQKLRVNYQSGTICLLIVTHSKPTKKLTVN